MLPAGEIKLKLIGAYERLEKVPNDQYQVEALLGVLQNLLNDIYQKIQMVMESTPDSKLDSRTHLLQGIMNRLLD